MAGPSWFNYEDVRWYENLGGGSFGPPRVLRGSVPFAWVGAGDLDGDGRVDVVVSTVGHYFDDGDLVWYPNTGGGGFGPARGMSYGIPTGPVHPADLDGDGDLEVLVKQGIDALESVVQAYGNVGGPWTFTTEALIVHHSAAVESPFTITDLDGDGDPDVVSASSYRGQVQWSENLGGKFTVPESLGTLPEGRIGVFASDLDGDGRTDVLTSSEGTGDVGWRRNLGGGRFGVREPIAVTGDNYLRPLSAADLDGDGDQDVIAEVGGGVGVLRNGLATDDHDRDGLPRRVEVCVSGTDPWLEDTDGGGVPDAEELLVLTDPLEPADDVSAPDSDGDGLADGAEIHWHGTDPFNPDTDGGGIDDGDEVDAGGDPLDPSDG